MHRMISGVLSFIRSSQTSPYNTSNAIQTAVLQAYAARVKLSNDTHGDTALHINQHIHKPALSENSDCKRLWQQYS